MTFYLKHGVVILLLLASALARSSKPAPAAPIPQQILAAKKVFIANAGGDERWYDDAIFDGGPVRAYNEFYAAVRKAGRYEIAGSPADADLLLEIGLTAPMVSGTGAQRDSLTAKPYDPQLRLVIRDPKTNALLWAFTEHVQWAILFGNREKNFDQTMTRIVSDLQNLSVSSNDAQRP